MKTTQRIFGPIGFDPIAKIFFVISDCGGFGTSDAHWHARSLITSATAALASGDLEGVRCEITTHEGTESIVLSIGDANYITMQARKASGAWHLTGHSYWHQAGKCLAAIATRKGDDNGT